MEPKRTASDTGLQRLFVFAFTFSIPLVFLVTSVVLILGPSPTYPGSPTLVRDPYSTLDEPAERLVFIGWALAAGTMILFAFILLRKMRTDESVVKGRVATSLGVMSALLSALAVFWFYPPASDVPAITAVITGSVLLAFVLWIFRAPPGQAILANFVVSTLAVAIFFAVWVQSPGTIKDPYHFAFTAGEISGPAAGRVPLVDFFPQYSNLLGWPVAWILEASSLDTVAGSLAWMLLLQIIAVVAAFGVITSQGDNSLVAPRILLILAPLVMSQFSWAAPLAYFAVNPLRVVLPLGALALAVVLFKRLPVLPYAGIVGLAAGISLLNNPDFSTGVVIGSALAVVLKARLAKCMWVLGSVVYVGGLIAPFVIYDVLIRVTGNSVEWGEFLSSQLLFAQDGYMATIMRPFGLHTVVVATLIVGAVIGIVGCWIFPDRVALLLPMGLIGIWGFLCLPYFVNRSGTDTLMVGLAIPFSLQIASLLPLAKMAWITIATRGKPSVPLVAAVAVISILILGVTSLWALVPNPGYLLGRASELRASENAAVATNQQRLTELRGELEAKFGEPFTLSHVVKYSNLIATPDTPSISVVSDPHNFGISPLFVRRQCEILVRDTPTAIALEPGEIAWFTDEAACQPIFNEYGFLDTEDAGEWVVLVRSVLLGSTS